MRSATIKIRKKSADQVTMPSWNEIFPWLTCIFTRKYKFWVICFELELLFLLVFYMFDYTFPPPISGRI
jgi:hypothetical protein